MLFRSVQAAWATFVARAEAGERNVPRFCRREVEGYVRCGILGYGFARVHCDACRQDCVVAFSCKGRGFCPSCGTRRMVDTAAWLVDHVIPEVAVRQWVLSLPYRVRVLCAYDPEPCAAVRRILVRAVSSHYERAALARGASRPRAGAVAFVQRFDSALRVNVHMHVLWLDGVFTHEPGKGRVEFCEHAEVTDTDVGKLVQAIRDRVLRYLRRCGKLTDESEAEAGSGAEAERVAGHDRERLEYLCKYAGRPAVAESRLSVLPDGRVLYALKKRWKDGTTHVAMTPQVLMERLCALVPRPKKHLVTYHGVLAPAASIRPWVVPKVAEGDGVRCQHELVEQNDAGRVIEQQAVDEAAVRGMLRRRSVPHAPGKRRRGGRRYTWAELLRRVYLIEVLVCAHCGGTRRLLAAMHDPESIHRVLTALGLPTKVPELAAARGPPAVVEWSE